MNGKAGSRRTAPGYGPPPPLDVQADAPAEAPVHMPAPPEELELAALPKTELVRLVRELQNQVADYAAPVARVLFILTVASIPWRYRFTLLERPMPPIYRDYTDFLLFVPDLFLLGMLVMWLLSLAWRPRPVSFGPALISLPLAGLSLLGALSALRSVDPSLSLYHALRLCLLFGFYLYVLNEIRSWRDLALPAGLLVFSQAMVAIPQVLAQRSLNLAGLGEYALDPSWSGISIATANGVRFLRAYGLSDHPNILGGCLAFALLMLGVQFATGSRSSTRVVLGALFGVGALALLVTFSRSAWLAYLAGGALTLFLFAKTRQAQPARQWLFLNLSAVLLLAPFCVYLAPYLGIRLGVQGALADTPAEQQSLGERQLLNQLTNQVFAAEPLTGAGLGALPLAMRAIDPDYPLNYQPAHLVLLDVAAETGLFGALFYSLLLAAPWLALWVLRQQLQFTPLLVGALGLLLAVSVVSFWDYYPWLLVPGRLWAWLSWGLVAAAFLANRPTRAAHA